MSPVAGDGVRLLAAEFGLLVTGTLCWLAAPLSARLYAAFLRGDGRDETRVADITRVTRRLVVYACLAGGLIALMMYAFPAKA